MRIVSLALVAGLLAGIFGRMDRVHAADTTPPSLIFSQPEDGATGVLSLFPLILAFDEPMGTTASIGWSSNVNAALVSFSWVDDTTLMVTYPPGWPADATITWVLNPTAGQANAFKDASGNPLPAATFRGSFSLGTGGGGGGPTTPCPAAEQEKKNGSVGVFKASNWVQANSGPPTPQTETPAAFLASVEPPANGLVSAATLQTPTGTTRTLTNFFGSGFFFFQPFASEAALDVGYPAGTYLLSVVGGNPVPSTIALPANGYPPVPHIANYNAAQAINPDADFALQWDPIPGVGPNDSIALSISDERGEVFSAPDICVPRELPASASSIVIPRGTLKSGKNYSGSLSFFRYSLRANNVFPQATGGGGLSRATEFGLKTTGGTGLLGAPKFLSIVRKDNGSVEMVVQAQPGSTVIIDRSADLTGWAQIQSVPMTAAGIATVTDTSTTAAVKNFYRAKHN
ncbi:MAG: hypothetical protein FJ404_01360 [Verrucomicrobia bacterium]|nr:hypothetical protein [Verrucomicrobiota bacterium]